METSIKKGLSDALKNALKDEHLWTHQAATLLNLNPQYISMMLNPNSFDKCGITAWSRVGDWFKTKDSLSNYKFPADETIWKPKEKAEEKDFNIQSPKKQKGVPKMKNPSPPPEKKNNGQTSKVIVGKLAEVADFPSGPKLEKVISKKDFEGFTDVLKDQIIEDMRSKLEALAFENQELKNMKDAPNILKCEEGITNQKLTLDIEINLLICGQKIQMKF